MRKIYVFYADVFLVQNFLMDLLAIVGVNRFLRRQKKLWRLAAAAAAASVGGLFLLLTIKNTLLYMVFSHLFVNTGMVFLAFGRCRKKEFLENWAVTYLVVILLGGMLQWLVGRGLTPAGLVPAAAGISGVYLILAYLRERKNFSNHIFEAQMKKRERAISVKAYWDSGNQLRDPYTGQGVCILSEAKAKLLFDEEQDNFRLVPYCSLGASSGLLRVVDVDELQLFDGGKRICSNHVAVGIADEKLLENRAYDLILHTSFL